MHDDIDLYGRRFIIHLYNNDGGVDDDGGDDDGADDGGADDGGDDDEEERIIQGPYVVKYIFPGVREREDIGRWD